MIGLCLKTYMIKNDDITKMKKGVSRKSINNPDTLFSNVLNDAQPASGVNVGFRCIDNSVYTYNQERSGFSYFYCKRRVADDGIHTSPLDVTLCPINK